MRKYQYLVHPSISTSASWSSSAIQLQYMNGAAIGCVLSTSASSAGGVGTFGTLTVQGSVDGQLFTPLQNSGVNVTLTVATSGVFIFDIINTQLQYLRVGYTRIASSGFMSVTAYSKGMF